MLDSQVQGGWELGPASNKPSNPFEVSNGPNPFAGILTGSSSQGQPNGAGSSENPFISKTGGPNPFEAPIPKDAVRRAPSSFGNPSNFTSKPNPFGNPSGLQVSKPTTPAINPFAKPNDVSKPAPGFTNGGETPAAPSAVNKGRVAEYVQPAWPQQTQQQRKTPASNVTTTGAGTSKGQINGKRKGQNENVRRSKFSRNSPDPLVASNRSHSFAPKNNGVVSSTNDGAVKLRFGEDRDEFANKIRNQLAKDNIVPPRWPKNPGSHAQRQAMEKFREVYQAYRERARKSLMRAGLIDDPDKKRRLDQALVFKGICEDMCPEWEQVTRIVQHDIKRPEKDSDENDELVAEPSLMVKRLARSAAGQDAPLPMDVRSVRCLRETLNYLIDLVPSDDLLPQTHNFLWDRTRAIRIDFSFQKYAMTPEEIQDQIYCLETIARLHVTALHLLSRDGFTPSDFSEQQEVEQLSKTLISLMEVYDDCAQQGIKCENEAEFRAYYIVFNAFNPALNERIEGWDLRFGDSQGIQSAICITECLDNIRKLQGPLAPETYSQMAVDAASIYFRLIASPTVSYTMACFAEIHFNNVRKTILKLIRKSFSRPRFGPKDLTPSVLKEQLFMDTEAEAITFCEKHGFQFHDNEGYVILSPVPEYTDARVPHAFSGAIVERKRSGHTFPEVVRSTIFELSTSSSRPPIQEEGSSGEDDSLFVSNAQDVFTQSKDQENGVHQGLDDGAKRSAFAAPPVSSPSLPASKSSDTSTVAPSPFTQPGKQTGAGPFLQSQPSKPSISQGQPPASVLSQPSGVFGIQPLGSVPPSSGSTKQPPASIFGQPKKEIGDQPTSSIFPNATAASGHGIAGGKTFSQSSPAVPADTKPEPEHKESFSTQASSSTGKKVRFQDDLSSGQGSAPTDNAGTPGLFGFLNKKDDGKEAAAPSTTANASIFSGPPPKQLDLLNKGPPQIPASSGVPAIFGSKASSSSGPVSSTTAPAAPKVEKPVFPTATSSTTIQQPTTAPPVSSSAATATQPNKPDSKDMPVKKDLMGDFTRWLVCGDKGLMESELQELAVEHVLRSTWDNFYASEQERIRKEEDEKSWEEALKFRRYSLSVTYFYRWLDIFRKRRVVRRIQQEKERARQWKLPANVAKRELAAKEEQRKIVRDAQESMLRRSQRNVNEAAELRASTRSSLERSTRSVESKPDRLSDLGSLSPESRAQSIEDALLATGIFDGMRDEKAAARYAAMEGDDEFSTGVFEKKMRLRTENHRRVKRGLNPLKALPEPRPIKEGYKTAMLRASFQGAGRDTLSMSMSTGSLRNSTFSSSYRSSLGFNNSRVSKSRPRNSDPYWRLKANGLVRMPNGEYLHESIALPMLREGKRIPGFGDYGLPPVESGTPTQSPPLPGSGCSSLPIHADELRLSDSPSPPGSQKRKRRADGEDGALNGDGPPISHKRVRSGDGNGNGNGNTDSVTDADDHLASIASLLARVENSVSRVKSSKKGQ
ncbi:SAC3/GANP/Nin1/mts3/eIF-3 p25 family-domain-containing protein [Hypomontagnella monticulosa]|nr:SAC3/GANP/Nin1/mts3/eIF-3 p25 family-domain-containing protein [Hypomontagnella monticulosa]